MLDEQKKTRLNIARMRGISFESSETGNEIHWNWFDSCNLEIWCMLVCRCGWLEWPLRLFVRLSKWVAWRLCDPNGLAWTIYLNPLTDQLRQGNWHQLSQGQLITLIVHIAARWVSQYLLLLLLLHFLPFSHLLTMRFNSADSSKKNSKTFGVDVPEIEI